MWRSYSKTLAKKRMLKRSSSNALTNNNTSLDLSSSSTVSKNSLIYEINSDLLNNSLRQESTMLTKSDSFKSNSFNSSESNEKKKNSLNLSNNIEREIPTESLSNTDQKSVDLKHNFSMFEKNSNQNRPPPEPPTTEGIEYPRAASWSSSTVDEILRDPLGKQLFRTFLYEALAEENLLFVEALDEIKKEQSPQKIKTNLEKILQMYGSFINLSSVAMAKLQETTESDNPDFKNLEICYKEIYKLLENDQFPRFRRSNMYLEYLEKLLPRVYAERWATSFDALLGNQVGRHHFRQYLLSVHAEENLRFWESVVEFRGLKNKSTAMLNMGKTIHQQFLKEGGHNEVFLPFGLRQRIEKKIKEKDVDETLFDDAIKHVEQILKNDSYVRFLQSKEYNNLLNKLH